MKKDHFSTGSLSIVLFVIVILGVLGVLTLRLLSNRSPEEQPASITIPTPSVQLESSDEPQQILQSLQASGLECGTAGCTVDKVVGEFAKGNMPMAYWIAKKVDGVWQVVVTGNGIPQCLEIDTYSIPQEIYGNCIEESGELRN